MRTVGSIESAPLACRPSNDLSDQLQSIEDNMITNSLDSASSYNMAWERLRRWGAGRYVLLPELHSSYSCFFISCLYFTGSYSLVVWIRCDRELWLAASAKCTKRMSPPPSLSGVLLVTFGTVKVADYCLADPRTLPSEITSIMLDARISTHMNNRRMKKKTIICE